MAKYTTEMRVSFVEYKDGEEIRTARYSEMMHSDATWMHMLGSLLPMLRGWGYVFSSKQFEDEVEQKVADFSDAEGGE